MENLDLPAFEEFKKNYTLGRDQVTEEQASRENDRHKQHFSEAYQHHKDKEKAAIQHALKHGQANDWQFDTKEEAEEISKIIRNHENCRIVKYDGQYRFMIDLGSGECRYPRQNDQGKWCVVLVIEYLNCWVDKTKLEARNDLGIPIVFY